MFVFGFLTVSLLGYYLCPQRSKNLFLVLVSFAFYYICGHGFIVLLAASVIFNYFAGLLVGGFSGSLKRLFLAVGVSANLLVLFYYKYINLLLDSANRHFLTNFEIRAVILPVGISFFTFKAVSYLVDVYRGQVPANRNFIEVALYISVFPQVTSGPISPYADLAPQLASRRVTVDSFAYGIQRFSYGLAKKVVIADVLGKTADQIFYLAEISQADASIAWLGALCYTLQIYFDFSGYTDMAIGIGKMFGFSFMENFNYPYISRSVTEFWRRWHISLSSWFKNYLYIPLGGNRRGIVYVNLIVVFLATGMWHGSSLKFVVWGLWHGFFMLMERATRRSLWYEKTPDPVKWAVTILVIMLGWVMFRAASFAEGLSYLRTMFGLNGGTELEFTLSYYLKREQIFTIIVGIILSTPIIRLLSDRFRERKWFPWLRLASVQVLLLIGIIYVVNSTYAPHIYFQF